MSFARKSIATAAVVATALFSGEISAVLSDDFFVLEAEAVFSLRTSPFS